MIRRIGIALVFITTVHYAQAQELQNIRLSGSKSVTAFVPKGGPEIGAVLPLASFEADQRSYTTAGAPGKLAVTIGQAAWNGPGYKATLTFKNTSQDTVSLSNVVPLGRSKQSVYITGKGDHGLSRSHIFIPGRTPVNCILPDNAWELGYNGVMLKGNTSACALVRRDGKSLEKGSRRRFETVLYPGGSVSYSLYIDLYTGDWQQGLKKMFQERYLYDVERFDDALFQREDLKWIRHSYVMHLLMAWDKEYYTPEDGQFHLDSFLQRGKRLYGGDDGIGLWPTWPALGIDQRNQFDMFRDLPGGLPQVRKNADLVRSMGAAFFICYNPWDESTRSESHLSGLADIIKGTGADGVVLDTKGSSSVELQDAADGVKKGVVMYSEGMAVPRDMQGIVSGRVHNALYYPPMLNMNKFIKPEFAIFRVAELFKEPIRREFATSFFNGYGTELNCFAPGKPDWVDEQYGFLGRTSRILREHTYNFTSQDYTPLIPTTEDLVYANRWKAGDKTVYTIFSLIAAGYKGVLFDVPVSSEMHYVDVWHHSMLEPIKQANGKYGITAETDAFNSAFLGTNNEGAVDCIVQFPKLIDAKLDGDVLQIGAGKGDAIKIWAGVPDYEKQPLEMKPGNYTIHLLEKFGRFEGKFVIQLFDKGILMDENIVSIDAGIPRLASVSEPTVKASSAKGMISIPAGSFIFKVTNGDEFIPYPAYNQGRTYNMQAFLIDQFPVTNAQYQEFIKASKYLPSDTANYLKHWNNGQFPAGQENYPVVYVSYEDAKAYARWAGKRLPTEIEWQYAAQTPDARAWPWSNDTKHIYRETEPVTNSLTVYKIKGIDSTFANLGNGVMDPVGKYPKGANPYGLQDLVGSVWQLTNDVYKSGSYTGIIMKGGSYYNPTSSWWYVQGGPRELHYRQYLLRVSQGFERNATVGFRCVKDQ